MTCRHSYRTVVIAVLVAWLVPVTALAQADPPLLAVSPTTTTPGGTVTLSTAETINEAANDDARMQAVVAMIGED